MDNINQSKPSKILLLPRNEELLISPEEFILGEGSDVEYKNIEIRIGDRPYAVNFYRLFDGNNIPKQYKELSRAFKIWGIFTPVGIMQLRGLHKISEIGLKISYPDEPKVTILDMYPQTKFIKYVEGSWITKMNIGVDTSSMKVDLIEDLMETMEGFFGGFNFKLSTNLEIGMNLPVSIMTTNIIATGRGDHFCQWLLKKHDKPLVGDQMFFHVMITPDWVEEIKFKTQVYANISGFCGLPVRCESEWKEMEVELVD